MIDLANLLSSVVGALIGIFGSLFLSWHLFLKQGLRDKFQEQLEEEISAHKRFLHKQYFGDNNE